MKDIVKYVNENMCEPHSHELLYLCKFGSFLYGVNSFESDMDYKGIFLPSKKSMLLGQKCRSLRYKSGDDNSRNTNEDVDIELWSLQYFLELLGKGETGAIDLVYSITNTSAIEYLIEGECSIQDVFKQPLNFFDPRKCKSFISYCINQAKSYGIKGSRLGVIKQVYEFLHNHTAQWDWKNVKLDTIIDDLIKLYYDQSYCFTKEINGEQSLVVCGKVHLLSITLQEFYNRINREYHKYGDRAKKAEQSQGIDWKALHHAVRCLTQMEQLLTNGIIEFPLHNRKMLLDIKQGKYTFQEVEEIIVNGLDHIEYLQNTTKVTGKKNNKLIEKIILSHYGEL